MRRILLILLLLTPAWAASGTEALVQQLVASDRQQWPALLAAYQDSVDTAALKALGENARSLPLETARKTAEACDAVAAKAAPKYEGLAQLGLVRELLRTGRRPEALEVARGLAAAQPALQSAQQMLGFTLMENGQYEEARTVFAQVTKAAPFYELGWLELGRANVFLNRRDEALAAFKEVLAINPDNGFARDAVAAITTGVPVRIKTNKAAREHFEKAEGFFADHEFEKAIAEYKLAAQADPKFAKPLVYIGDCWFQLGDLDQAITSYQAALQVDPRDKQGLRFLGEMFERKFDRTGEMSWLDQALDCYRQALKSDPGYGAAQSDLERAEAKKKR